jgi:hypothetical protein
MILCADWILLLNSEVTENFARSIERQDMTQIKNYNLNQIRENMRKQSLSSVKIILKNADSIFKELHNLRY